MKKTSTQTYAMASFITDVWHRIWDSIIDNRHKLTATGGFLVGILVTLGFKDFYPDLELAYRRRVRQLRGLPHPRPGESDYVRLEDHTKRKSSILPSADGGNDPRRLVSGAVIQTEVSVGVEGLIGNTPLIKLRSLSDATGCEIFAKAEFLNGAGNSPKDRVALSMITHAEEDGILQPDRGDTIYEGTVGSTGISLASVARARGYKAHMYVVYTIHSWEIHLRTSRIAACLTTSPSKRAISSSNSVRLLKESVQRPLSTKINSSTQHVVARKNTLMTPTNPAAASSPTNSKTQQTTSRTKKAPVQRYTPKPAADSTPSSPAQVQAAPSQALPWP